MFAEAVPNKQSASAVRPMPNLSAQNPQVQEHGALTQSFQAHRRVFLHAGLLCQLIMSWWAMVGMGMSSCGPVEMHGRKACCPYGAGLG